MPMIDIGEIAEVLQWNEQRDKNDTSKVGIFIKLPRELARQFPEIDKDSSPTHITVLFVGTFYEHLEYKMVKIVQAICTQFKPFVVTFGPKVRTFPNEGDGIIVYSPVKSGKLRNFHDSLKYALLENQIQVDNKHPNYAPHVTIGYANNKEEKSRLKELTPQGEFLVKDVWIWGLGSPKLITLGKK